MKIRKLFKRAAAFALAAVTALSAVPATTAFAAGDIGKISFTHTYDGAGNAIRYNSSANIGGHTAGGTGEYKYRMYVDGETAFCLQPGVPLKTGNTLAKASSNTWNALSAEQKKAVGLALLYGYQGNSGNLSGSDDEKWLATQTLVWEFVTGCRNSASPYSQTSTTVYSLHFGSNYANSGARAAYDQIVSFMTRHSTIPSFMSTGKKDITKELAYKDGKYSLTLTDKNNSLSEYSFTSSDSSVKVSKSGNKLTITSKKAIDGKARITATRNNTPTVSSGAKMIAYGDPNLQDVITGVENVDSMMAYINVETPTGTVALKKTSEDGVVAGISFTIKGDGFNKTVKTDKDGNITVEGLFPGTYTVTIAVQSAGTRATATVNATISAASSGGDEIPPLDFKEIWNLSTTAGNADFANACRNMDVDTSTGKMYVVHNNKEIYILDARTGVKVGELPLTGVSGGTLTLIDVKCHKGRIYACNLKGATNSVLHVYEWTSDEAEPTCILNTSSTEGIARTGDCLGVSGDPAGQLVLSFAAADGDNTAIIEFTRNNGTWTSKKITAAGIKIGTSPRAIKTDNGYWLIGGEVLPTFVNASGVKQHALSGESVVSGNDIRTFSYDGKNYALVTSYLNKSNTSLADGCMNLYEVDSSWKGSDKVSMPSAGGRAIAPPHATPHSRHRSPSIPAPNASKPGFWSRARA